MAFLPGSLVVAILFLNSIRSQSAYSAVIPAKAGTHRAANRADAWVPALAQDALGRDDAEQKKSTELSSSSAVLVRMSRAFLPNDDRSAAEDTLERPVSPHPNLVTPEGLAQIEAELAALRGRHAAVLAEDRHEEARRLERELRYWTTRRRSAQVIEGPPEEGRVAFGARVRIRRHDGREESYRIVGEDEADPAQGTVSYVSPIARALIGGLVGETVRLGVADVEIIAIG
jgi:transcription elongation GreA/GreB family factor